MSSRRRRPARSDPRQAAAGRYRRGGNPAPRRGGQGTNLGTGHLLQLRRLLGLCLSHGLHPGHVRTDTIVRVETLIYTVAGDKLIYAAHSRTFNPTDTAEAMKEIAESVAKDLKKRGLLD